MTTVRVIIKLTCISTTHPRGASAIEMVPDSDTGSVSHKFLSNHQERERGCNEEGKNEGAFLTELVPMSRVQVPFGRMTVYFQ